MKKILWSKWKDPLYPLVDNWVPDYDESMPDAGKSTALYYPQKEGIWNGPVLMGPQGTIPLTESNLPGVLFNFWNGDTNFTLTKAVAKLISKIDGVESLDIITRYRFRVGIGKAFNERAVKRAIQNLVEPPEVVIPTKSPDRFAAVKSILAKKYTAWAIIVLPNNKYEYVGGEKSEVEDKLKAYAGKSERLLLSWEQ